MRSGTLALYATARKQTSCYFVVFVPSVRTEKDRSRSDSGVFVWARLVYGVYRSTTYGYRKRIANTV
jgi:hypothetical protein